MPFGRKTSGRKKIWPSAVAQQQKDKRAKSLSLLIPLVIVGGIACVGANFHSLVSARRSTEAIILRPTTTENDAPTAAFTSIPFKSTTKKKEAALSLKELLMPQIDKSAKRSWETEAFLEQTRRNRQPLNFVHIPKTGGSSIVAAGIKAGLNWGDCLFRYSWPGQTCPSPPNATWPATDPELGTGCWWHSPIQHLPSDTFGNPYQGHDLFGVIRNPYDRAVSEFFYKCQLGACKGMWDYPAKAVGLLNTRIANAVRVAQRSPPGTAAYFSHWGHWIPQHHFFYNNDNPQQQMIQHLLHTEHLNEEFASLMKAYRLAVVLPEEKEKGRNIVAGKFPLGVQNLTKYTMKLIEKVYEGDFELGGYRRLSSILHPENNGPRIT